MAQLVKVFSNNADNQNFVPEPNLQVVLWPPQVWYGTYTCIHKIRYTNIHTEQLN